MKLKLISYSRLANLGNFRNERVAAVARLEEGDDLEACYAQLKEQVLSLLGPEEQALNNNIYLLQKDLKDLERKTQKAREQWEITAEFLRTQGIKPDAPAMPSFLPQLAPGAPQENDEIEGELLEDDEYKDEDEDEDEDIF